MGKTADVYLSGTGSTGKYGAGNMWCVHHDNGRLQPQALIPKRLIFIVLSVVSFFLQRGWYKALQ